MTTAIDDGYLVHHEAFTAAEVADLRDAVDGAVDRAADLVAHTAAHAPDRLRTWNSEEGRLLQEVRGTDLHSTTVHWEPDTGAGRVMRNLRPVTHLDRRLDRLWDDPRLTAPAARLLGVDAVAPLTSKISVKRAHVGSAFVWHQDHSFLAGHLGHDRAAEVAVVMVVVDDADAAHGALWLVPGTHRGRARPDHEAPGPGDAAPVRVDARAGAVVAFPTLMVHRSDANHSGRDRRALFLLYQPAGRPHLDETRDDPT